MDFLGERAGNARHRLDVFQGRRTPRAGTAEVMQQRTLTRRPDAGNLLQAGLATGQGTPALLKTLLGLVSGVQTRLIGRQRWRNRLGLGRSGFEQWQL